MHFRDGLGESVDAHVICQHLLDTMPRDTMFLVADSVTDRDLMAWETASAYCLSCQALLRCKPLLVGGNLFCEIATTAHTTTVGAIKQDIVLALLDLGVARDEVVQDIGAPFRRTAGVRWASDGGLIAAQAFDTFDMSRLPSAPIEIEFGVDLPLEGRNAISSLASVVSRLERGHSINVKQKADLLIRVPGGPDTVIVVAGDLAARSLTAGVLRRTPGGPVLHRQWVTVTSGDRPGQVALPIPVAGLYRFAPVPASLQGVDDLLLDLRFPLQCYLAGRK
ncbi:Uncharacterized protein PBTT_09466 [Plasmodiophora brassicae]